METALEMEKDVYQKLVDLHSVCAGKDVSLSMLSEKMIEEQVASIKSFGDHITRLKRAGPGLGEFLFDKEL